MSTATQNFATKTVDWRQAIARNNRKTFFVIGAFLLIYLAIGVLADLAIYANTFPQADVGQIFFALLTLHLFPTATVVMLCIAGISLWVTFALHDRLMLLGTEYKLLDPREPLTPDEQQLWNVVEELKIAAGLHFMPRVYLIDADYMNAFASGYSEKSAMVAITRGLMEKLNRSELQAVMAHEMSHIRHLDIKLTLCASVLANFVVIVLDFFFYNMLFSNRRNDDRSRGALFAIIMLLRYLLPLINVLLLLYLSRSREYMADAGCVELTRDNQPLAHALLKINNDHLANREHYHAAYQQTPHENVRREAYIFDPVLAGIESTGAVSDLFSTHPSLEKRLKALGYQYQPEK